MAVTTWERVKLRVWMFWRRYIAFWRPAAAPFTAQTRALNNVLIESPERVTCGAMIFANAAAWELYLEGKASAVRLCDYELGELHSQIRDVKRIKAHLMGESPGAFVAMGITDEQ